VFFFLCVCVYVCVCVCVLGCVVCFGAPLLRFGAYLAQLLGRGFGAVIGRHLTGRVGLCTQFVSSHSTPFFKDRSIWAPEKESLGCRSSANFHEAEVGLVGSWAYIRRTTPSWRPQPIPSRPSATSGVQYQTYGTTLNPFENLSRTSLLGFMFRPMDL
jgi:hypothetical protein